MRSKNRSNYYRSGSCRYCNYSAGDFEVFRPAGATRFTDQREIGQVPSAVRNSTLIREYLGVSGPKNAKNCQNFQHFRPTGANPLPNVDEICKVYAVNRSTKTINIWCDSVSKLEIYRQKTRWGIPAPPKKKSESL